MSEDLPVVIEIIDSEDKAEATKSSQLQFHEMIKSWVQECHRGGRSTILEYMTNRQHIAMQSRKTANFYKDFADPDFCEKRAIKMSHCAKLK